MKTKPWLLFALLLILSYYRACFSIAGDNLSAGHSLSFAKNETLLSQGGTFELGFFKPGTSSNIYLGIWYKMFVSKEVVWLANRENPLSDPSSSKLILSDDGNLLLFERSSKVPVWSTNLTFPKSNLTEAVVCNDGNFVLRDKSNPSSIIWESFDHPTDTLLPGSKLGIDKVTGKPQQLISWKNSEDPTPGVFSLGLDPNGSNQFFLEWNRSQIYWSSGVWNGKIFSSVPEMNELSSTFNYTFVSSKNGSERYFMYSLHNASFLSKYRVGSEGQVMEQISGPREWTLFWHAPWDQSDVYALCGAFGVSYRDNTSSPCGCLKGFKPFSMEDSRLNDWSGGCVRKSPLQCENNTYANATKDRFMEIPNVRLPVNSKAYSGVNAMNCQVACLKNCSCTAYAYNSSGYCITWEGALLNLQKLSDGGGQNIYLRLAADEHPVPSTKGRMSGEMKDKKWKVWVAVLVPTTGLILCLFICLISSKGKLKCIGEKASSNNLLLFDFDTELHAINERMNTDNNRKKSEKDAELPLFSYESISATTNNFSTMNKLGEGGFGPVYKAWELWIDDQILDLLEPTIGYPSSTSVLLRFINIGLLCVQESPTDRPTMPDVVSMISNEDAPLLAPKQPAFTRGRNVIDTDSTIDSVDNCSKNSVTISTMEAR